MLGIEVDLMGKTTVLPVLQVLQLAELGDVCQGSLRWRECANLCTRGGVCSVCEDVAVSHESERRLTPLIAGERLWLNRDVLTTLFIAACALFYWASGLFDG
jgi:hypothetical protein